MIETETSYRTPVTTEWNRAVQDTLDRLASPVRAKLFAAIGKAQSQMAGAAKDSLNPHFKSKYADLASCWDACRKPLTDNGLTILQPVKADGPQVTVTTILAHSSGEWISESLTMTAGANTPQAIGSTITYGRRYGLCAMVGIAPEDDDGEAGSQQETSTPAERQIVADNNTVYMPDGLDGSDLPEGVVYLAQVAPGMGSAKGFIRHTRQAVNEPGLPIYKQFDQARQWCPEGVPVKLTFKTSKQSGKPYVDKIEPVRLVLVNGKQTVEDLPF
jgi:hypothetical protein